MSKKSQLLRLASCFVAGIIATNTFFALKSIGSIFITGSRVICQSSFPRYHDACVYSRPGLGEQAISLVIDDKTVYFVSDQPGGNLHERIVWDESGSFVTFHVDGLAAMTYNAKTRHLTEDGR